MPEPMRDHPYPHIYRRVAWGPLGRPNPAGCYDDYSPAGDTAQIDHWRGQSELIASLDPRPPGTPIVLSLALADGAARRVRAVLIDVAVALHRGYSEGRDPPPGRDVPEWRCTCTLTGAGICHAWSRRDVVAQYRRRARESAAAGGDWLAARMLQAAGFRAEHGRSLGGEVRA